MYATFVGHEAIAGVEHLETPIVHHIQSGQFRKEQIVGFPLAAPLSSAASQIHNAKTALKRYGC